MALRDLFRRGGPSASTPIPPELGRALGELSRLAERPELAEPAAVLERVLRATFGRPATIPNGLHADPELIVAAWRSGVPAFQAGDSAPALDAEDVRARALAICQALEGVHADATRLSDALRRGTVDLVTLWPAVLEGRETAFEEAARRSGGDLAFLHSVCRLALLPLLSVFVDRLAGLGADANWTGRGCPNCGSPPALGESRGLERRRQLRCGLCAGDWPGDRLRCPFCGESDHRRLSYSYIDGEEERLRLVECQSCEGRLKVISTLSPLSPPSLLVAELGCSHL